MDVWDWLVSHIRGIFIRTGVTQPVTDWVSLLVVCLGLHRTGDNSRLSRSGIDQTEEAAQLIWWLNQGNPVAILPPYPDLVDELGCCVEQASNILQADLGAKPYHWGYVAATELAETERAQANLELLMFLRNINPDFGLANAVMVADEDHIRWLDSLHGDGTISEVTPGSVYIFEAEIRLADLNILHREFRPAPAAPAS